MNKVREARLKRRRTILKIAAAVATVIFIIGLIGSCVTGQTLYKPDDRAPEVYDDFPDDFVTGHGG